MAIRGAAVRTSSAASDGAEAMSGVMVLDTAATKGAMTLSGNATVKTPSVYVNSSSSDALKVSGSAVLDSPSVNVVGGSSLTSPSACTSTIKSTSGTALDPYASLILPAADTANNLGTLSISGGTRTVSPGYYSGGISVTGNANVTFLPGVYVLGNGLSVSNGSISGDGVCFVVLGGKVTFGGNSSATLTPTATGNLSGVVIAQPSSNKSDLTVSGGGTMNIRGSIWAPAAKATLSGNSSATTTGPFMGDMLIVNTLTLSGTSLLTIGNPSYRVFTPQVTGLYD